MSRFTTLSLAGALIVAAALIGLNLGGLRDHADTVYVVGSANEPAKASKAKFNLTLGKSSSLTDHGTVGAELRRQTAELRLRLLDLGFAQESIEQGPQTSYDRYNNGRTIGYQFSQVLTIRTDAIEQVAALVHDPNKLYRPGCSLNLSAEYYLDPASLPALKQGLLARATEDATARAEAMVKNTGRQY